MSEPLKLIALDAEDLAVLSLHMQDAVVRVGDMAFLPQERRFAAIANRFDWHASARAGDKAKPGDLLRHRTALRFERVLAAKVSGINLKDKTRTLAILALKFEEAVAPAGSITIICAGDAAIRLEVECLEAELSDLGASWATTSRPNHADGAPPARKPE